MGCSRFDDNTKLFFQKSNFDRSLSSKSLFAPTFPSSACNAYVAGGSMVIREAMMKYNVVHTGYIQNVIFHVFFHTGKITCEKSADGITMVRRSCVYRTIDMLSALDCVRNNLTCIPK